MPFDRGGFISIYLNVDGSVVDRKLGTFGRYAGDLTPAWEQIGNDLLEDFRWNFDSEGAGFDWAFGGWDALAAFTVRDRERHGYGGEGPILERTGALRQSTTQRYTPGNIFQVRSDGVTVGTDDPKAHWHQHGTRRMPARPIVGLTRYRKALVVDTMRQFVRDGILASGLEE